MKNILNTSGSVIFTSEPATNLRESVVEAVSKGISLACADLTYADLRTADLRNANLECAVLTGADLRGANLSNANLSNADLTYADFTGANLSNADLRYADLRGANLRGTILRGTNLRNANLDFSVWPLWCGSLGVKADDKLVGQLAFHLFDLAKSSGIELTMSEQIKELISKSSPITKHGKTSSSI